MSVILGVLVGLVIAVVTVSMGLGLAFVFSMWSSFVTMKLWNWFVIPIFGLEPIHYWAMFGMMIAFQAIKGYKYKPTPKEDENLDSKEKLEVFAKAALTQVTTYAFALLMGWLVHKYIM